jgi:hypothetical protein
MSYLNVHLRGWDICPSERFIQIFVCHFEREFGFRAIADRRLSGGSLLGHQHSRTTLSRRRYIGMRAAPTTPTCIRVSLAKVST